MLPALFPPSPVLTIIFYYIQITAIPFIAKTNICNIFRPANFSYFLLSLHFHYFHLTMHYTNCLILVPFLQEMHFYLLGSVSMISLHTTFLSTWISINDLTSHKFPSCTYTTLFGLYLSSLLLL